MVGKAQFILILGAMLILSQLSLTVNASMMNMKDVSYGNEAILAGTTLAQSVLRDIASKNFDERTIGRKVAKTDTLTTPMSLGPEVGEAYPNFNDVDDYDQHVRTESNARLGNFTVAVRVWYTSRALLGGASPSATFMKAVTVTVSGNRYLPKSIVASTIISY